MKVDFSSGVSIYRKSISGIPAPISTDAVSGSPKTDVIEFSHGSTGSVDKNMLTFKSKVQRDISYPADAKRIEKLHNMVKNHTYRIPTEDIVNAILND